MTLGWHVAVIRRREENALLTRLSQLEIETFSPRILVSQRHRRQMEPLFPGYLFCQIDSEDASWPQVRWAKGLKYFLGSHEAHTLVYPEVVEEIRARVDRWNDGGWANAFMPGERIRVTSGALEGLDGLFQHYLPAKERCQVLFSLVGRWIPVAVEIRDLESVTFRHRFAMAV